MLPRQWEGGLWEEDDLILVRRTEVARTGPKHQAQIPASDRPGNWERPQSWEGKVKNALKCQGCGARKSGEDAKE